jgi:hypothetical protein
MEKDVIDLMEELLANLSCDEPEATQILRRVQKTPNLRLLYRLDVIQWLLMDASFLKGPSRELMAMEKAWGVELLRSIRPDSTASNWGDVVGEEMVRELLLLEGQEATKPKQMKNYRLDLETATHMIEAKSQGIHMTGTANEKIPGVPFKYAEVPRLYGKPVRVLMVGGAEARALKDQLLAPTIPEKQTALTDFARKGFTFVGGSQILRGLK